MISWGRSLWGGKNDLFLPHRARCDILGRGPCGAEKVIISCPTGNYLTEHEGGIDSRKDGLALIEDLMLVVISWGAVPVGQKK